MQKSKIKDISKIFLFYSTSCLLDECSFIYRFHLSFLRSRGGAEAYPRQGSPWTGLQSITGLTHRQRQTFALTFTPAFTPCLFFLTG